MKKENESTISEILGQITRSPKFAPKLTKVKIQNAWVDIMGATVNRYTEQIYIRNNVVTIVISSPALRQDLFMSREQILLKINRYLGSDTLVDIKIK